MFIFLLTPPSRNYHRRQWTSFENLNHTTSYTILISSMNPTTTPISLGELEASITLPTSNTNESNHKISKTFNCRFKLDRVLLLSLLVVLLLVVICVLWFYPFPPKGSPGGSLGKTPRETGCFTQD